MARGDKEDNSRRRHTDEFNAWLASLDAMDVEELREYARQNKDVLTPQMKAALKKLMQKKQQPPKRRKKRTALHPILGAVLKFHRDDTPPPGPGGANA
ncbi:unnamed protein product [Alopecurus aequalis]